MPNIRISALPPATLPLDDPNTLFEVTVFEAGEEVSRKITLSEIAGATGLDASFVTVGANAQLANERVLTAGTDISIVDGGPNSTITISSTAAGTSFPLLAPDGSAVAPSYSFVNDSGAGMFLTALGELSFAADGVEIARAINLVNNQFAVAQSGASSVPDLTSLGDLDTGFRWPANNETVWMGGGSRAWNFSTVKFYSQFSNGPGLFNRIAQNDVVTVAPDHADDNTGLGASNDELSLIAGGVEIAQAKEAIGANQFIIAPGVVQNNEAAPSLAFGDGDTGFYEALANNLRVTIGGTERFFWEGDSFNAVAGTGPRMENLAAGATIPGFIPRRSDPNTGLASAGLDILTLVAGGIEAVRYAEVSSEVLQTNSAQVAIVASITQTQGQQPLLSSYNEVTGVANPDDVVTAPSVSEGLRLTIINNGGNNLQVFPASGDNIGGGVDGSITIGTGAIGVFLGRTSTDWNTLYNDVPSPSSGAAVPDPLLLSSGGVGVPTYSFAVDSDTGMYNIGADILGFTAGGVEGLRIEEVAGLITITAAGPLLASNGSETNPSHSFAGDPDCGMYREDTDRLAFTAGGVPAIMYQESFGTGILAASQNDTGLVASVTQTQAGGLVLRSSYNEVATVATTGDALTLQGPPTLASVTAKHTVVINNGANDLQLFPALGEDLGAGVNASITVVTGGVCVLLGRDGANWDVLYNDLPTPTFVIPDPLILNHTAVADDEFAFQINTDGAGFGDVKSIDINHETGAIGAGGDEAVILINIDEILATGGDIVGVEVLSTEGSADKITGLLVGAGIGAIEQLSGVFQDADTILNIAVDVTVALSSGGAGNISAFVADNDTMTAGLSTTFQEIEVVLDTPSSGAGIDPLFEFSTGVGTWGAFTPVDGTNGMRNNGVIAWELGDIPSWATGTGGEFLIRITRERNVLGTTPILDLMRVVVATEYFWNKDGDVDVNSITVNAGTAGSPSVAFGDGDTGFFENGDDILRVSFAGVDQWAWTASLFQGLAVDAPNIQNIASSGTVPNIRPNRSDGNTGLGSPAADQLSLIAGGVEMLRAIEAGTSATDQIFLPRDGAEATPALALGALDRGFWSGGVAQINASIGGTRVQFFNSSAFTQFGSIGCGNANSARLLNETASATNPTVVPNQADVDSGVGQSAADAVTLIAGAVQAVDYAEASSRIIQTNANHVGLTASVTQTQVGGLALLSSYNEIATVATTGDALTAFGVAEGSRLVVVNNGANDLQLFPAVGDDIGAGTNLAITIVAGAIGVFIGRTAAIWDTLYNAIASPGGGGASLPEFQFAPLTLENPNSADWTVNALAPAVADSNNAGLTVRLFDDTTEEGVGFQFEVPAGATNIIFTFRSRAETAPGVVNTVGLDIYNRGIPDNAAVQAWSVATALTDLSIPTNEFFQEDSQTVTLATLGVTAGELTQFELVRTAPGAGTDLTGDWALGNLKVSFS